MAFYKEKLQQIRKWRGFTQIKLASLIGCCKQAVQQWESGTVSPREHHVIALADALRCRVEDISDLKNPLEVDVSSVEDTSDEKMERIAKLQEEKDADPGLLAHRSRFASVTTGNHHLEKHAETTGLNPYSEVRPPSSKGCFVPIISQAAAATCNPGIQPLLDCVNEHSEKKAWFVDAREGDFVIEVSGESMNPWYPDGTLLLIRPYQELRNGQRVVAVLDTGEIIFKIYSAKADKICLFSIDKKGQDFIWTKPNVPLRYICRVIASQRNEDAIDEEMNHCGIHHDWQIKLSKV